MTRTVADAELMFRVLCEHDSRDSFAIRPEYIEQRSPDASQWAGKRVAFIERMTGIDVDPDVDEVVKNTLHKLEASGATIDPITLDDDADIRDVFRMHWYSGARQLSRAFSNDDMERLDPGFREVVEESREFTLDEFQAAATRRVQINSRLEQLHDTYDVIVSPAVPIKPFPVNQEVADPVKQQRWIDWAQYSYLFNLSQQPAASVPCGFTPDGCPVGLQIVGPRFSDYRLLGLCAGLEEMLASE